MSRDTRRRSRSIETHSRLEERQLRKLTKANLVVTSLSWVERLLPEFEIESSKGLNSLGRIPPYMLYCLIRKYVLHVSDRVSMNYPVEVKGRDDIAFLSGNEIYKKSSRIWERQSDDFESKQLRQCCRCQNRYAVNEEGDCIESDSCSYHWGPLRHKEFNVMPTYVCCENIESSPGCSSAKVHVCTSEPISSDGRFEYGYVKTQPRNKSSKGLSVLGLDCEMCFTSAGLEVTKVTLVKPDGKVIYNRLVRPERKIVDYNTRFSGLNSDDFVGITNTLANVQNELLKLINKETILIGHGLENDLKALKLHHPTVIDTTQLFPHFKGLPYRRSLRSLCHSILKKQIQTPGQPHDPVEDAQAALDLVFWKVFNDIKRRQMKSQESLHL